MCILPKSFIPEQLRLIRIDYTHKLIYNVNKLLHKVRYFVNILIVDDEQIFFEKIRKTVRDICDKEGISANIKVDDDPVSVIEDEKFLLCDVILLDIEMDDLSGIETAVKINDKKGKSDKPYIIFVTNRDDLVFEALKVQPYSFVRKSHLEDLRVCLKKIEERINEPDVYVIKTGRDTVHLFVSDIIYLEKKNNYVVFYTHTGVYKERTNIESKYADLKQYGFLRTQIGYLVNVKYIEDITDMSVLLSNGKFVPLSRKYKKSVKQDFYEWMVS